MMGIRDNILGAAKKGAGLVGNQVIAGLNRVDELGGDFRDYLLSQEDKPRLQKLGERLARFGGVNLEDNGEPSEYEQEIASMTESAPPPTAAEMDAAAALKGLGDGEIAAQIYGRKSCPWTGRAITLLNDAKVDYDFLDLDDSENGHFEGKLVSETKQNTVPYVYLRGEFVGGYNELNEVVRLGELDFRILSAADKIASKDSRMRVEIAARKD